MGEERSLPHYTDQVPQGLKTACNRGKGKKMPVVSDSALKSGLSPLDPMKKKLSFYGFAILYAAKNGNPNWSVETEAFW